MTEGMHNLRDMDKASRQLSLEIQAEESALLEEIKELQTKFGTEFDEEPLKQKHNNIMVKRADLLAMYDSQRNKAHDLYNQIDQKIKDFDIKTKNIQQYFPQFGGFEDVDKQKNKKKKKNDDEVIEDGPPLGVSDPNEPVYCSCKRVSFGQMVACENPDCFIEWYHFGCVGLKEEPNVWYCPSCRDGDNDKAIGTGSGSSSSNTVPMEN
jgi:inhibitor of growth protein 4